MPSSFKGKVVFITGGVSGIGRATALAFAEKEASVVVTDINRESAEALVNEMSHFRQPCCFMELDVTDPVQVQDVLKKIIGLYGKIDIAFNNAGIGGDESQVVSYAEENWDRVLAVNLSGVFYCMKYELEHMIEQKAGVIINTASVAGLRGFPWHAAYAASKHGVVGLTKSAAYEVAKHGIRINALCPGFTDTPMVSQMIDARPGLQEKIEKNIPLGRLADPGEMADAVLFLASDDNKFMSGHTMVLDGGATSV